MNGSTALDPVTYTGCVSVLQSTAPAFDETTVAPIADSAASASRAFALNLISLAPSGVRLATRIRLQTKRPQNYRPEVTTN
jgi:hypothetical protein